MSTYLAQIVFDAQDPDALATFWSDVLGWTRTIDRPDEKEIAGGPFDIPIGIVPDEARKRGKNRIHLDLGSRSEDERLQLVECCLDLGASPADIGQGDVAWTVLHDPEGNEFCILGPNPDLMGTGAVSVICLDADSIDTMREFWSAATGWVVHRQAPNFVALRDPSGRGPAMVMGPRVAPKTAKNRLHIDVRPPASADHREEVERLIAAGARPVDIGQSDVPWVVLSDPEGNEFCVLTPRDPQPIASTPNPRSE